MAVDCQAMANMWAPFYKLLKKLKKNMSLMHNKDFLASWKSKMIENDLAVFI